MLNTTIATDTAIGLAFADIIDEIDGLPADESSEFLRAAQDAVWHGAWKIPEQLREPMILAIGGIPA